MHSLAGVYAAAVTPLRADFSPDLDAVPALVEFLRGRGCHGILLLGTTGEGPSFSSEERFEILRAAQSVREVPLMENNGPCTLLAGTGTPSLSETISLTRSAFDLGYDGVVVLPPYYYRKATEEGLFLYFHELIQKAVPSDGFLLRYHIPSIAGIGFTLNLLSKLKEAFPTQFAGIKDSSHDADFALGLEKTFGPDLLVLTGTDSTLLINLENKGGGCITAPANLISPSLRRIWDAYKTGDDVTPLQAHVTRIRNILEKYTPFPPILKALLTRQYGLPHWTVRPPLEVVPLETLEKVAEELLAASG